MRSKTVVNKGLSGWVKYLSCNLQWSDYSDVCRNTPTPTERNRTMSAKVTISQMSARITEATIEIRNGEKLAAAERVDELKAHNNQHLLRNSEMARINRATALAIVNALASTTAGIASGKAEAKKMLTAGTLAYAVVSMNTLTNGGTEEAANMRLKDDAKNAGIEAGTVRHMVHPDGKHLRVVYRSHK